MYIIFLKNVYFKRRNLAMYKCSSGVFPSHSMFSHPNCEGIFPCSTFRSIDESLFGEDRGKLYFLHSVLWRKITFQTPFWLYFLMWIGSSLRNLVQLFSVFLSEPTIISYEHYTTESALSEEILQECTWFIISDYCPVVSSCI